MSRKAKSFDCVEMKRRGAAEIHERTKDMTPAELLEYWRQRNEAFRKEQEELECRGSTKHGPYNNLPTDQGPDPQAAPD